MRSSARKKKEQLDALKRALGMLNSDTSDIDISDTTKKNPDTDCDNNFFDEELPSRYLSEGLPDKLMMEALKELNIHDICDFLQENVPPDKPFKKESRASPPNYHLESSRGTVKDRLTAHQLKTYFGGKNLRDFSVLSSLGEGLTVVDNDHDVPTVGELVNRKRGKRRKKGSKATVPLEVVGMDIGYGEGVSVGGYKYVLILVDQCTTNSFLYGMHGCSDADVCEALWKFFIDAGGFPRTIQCDFDPWLIGGKAAQLLRSHST